MTDSSFCRNPDGSVTWEDVDGDQGEIALADNPYQNKIKLWIANELDDNEAMHFIDVETARKIGHAMIEMADKLERKGG